MENILKHAGYAGRTLVALSICAQAIGTLLCLLLNAQRFIPAIVLLCAVVTVVFGASSIIQVLKAPHFEGYVLLIGLALILQGAFTLATLLQLQGRSRKSVSGSADALERLAEFLLPSVSDTFSVRVLAEAQDHCFAVLAP